jgi:Ni,Fe-hydrogenase III component G
MKRVFLGVVMVLLPLMVRAAEKPLWVDSAGEAQMGEMDTQKEVKDRARRDAQSRAVEKAVGTFIKSHTLVSNYQLADDLVYAAVRGKIQKMDVLSEGWDEKDRNIYQVKIKALVAPVYPEKEPGLSLKVALSKNILKEGEETKIFYQANNDCYVYIFSIAADGSVTLLLPNAVDKNNRVFPDKAYEFPSANSPVKLEAMFLLGFEGKFSEERIKIIATRKEEAIVPLGFQEGMFKVFDAKSTGMVNDLVRKLNQIEPSEWTEATAVYKIIK